jgi:putative ABC transport system permease protein
MTSMLKYLKITFESIRQALLSLTTNKLRTILSLLGIMIGIFCIIAVLSAVDSLEANIKEGFKELGNDVIYIDKMPWNEDPNQNYWKYMKRPEPTIKDAEALQKHSKLANSVNFCIFNGGKSIKYNSTSISNAFIMGTTYDYVKLKTATIEKGRYFTPLEYERGANGLILGATVAQSLFGKIDPIGEHVKFLGQSFQVVGVLKKEGENMFNFINFDEVIWIGYNTAKKYINVSNPRMVGEMLCVQAKEGVDLDELKGEVSGIMRAVRRLRPIEDDDFALNELSMLEQVIGPLFTVLNVVGFTIGIFALIVGMFSVANIMFVSVKERTNIIGIKKALGATKPIILSEFLIESIMLCLLGGTMGIALVFALLKVATALSGMHFGLSAFNIAIGVFFSVFVGVVSGLIPAIQAANLDPVEAIRK